MEQHFQEVQENLRKKEAIFSYFKPKSASRPQSREGGLSNPNLRQLLRATSDSVLGTQALSARPITTNSVTRRHYKPRSKQLEQGAQPRPTNPEQSTKRTSAKLREAISAEQIDQAKGLDNLTTPEKIVAVGSQITKKFKQARQLDQALQRAEDNSSKCVLNDNDVPLIAETDHFTRRCFCHLCTCEQHQCPGANFRSGISTSAAFTTIYNKDYKRKTAPNYKEARRSLNLYHSNSQPMDFKTTNRIDFKPYKIEKTEPVKRDVQQPNLRFASRSLYNSEFPNWGPAFVEYEKQHHLPYRGKDVKIDGRTNYATEFTGASEKMKDFGLAKTGSESMYATGPISVSNKFFGQTESKATYGSGTEGFSTYSYAIKHNYMPSKCSSSHFTTTYTSEFTPKTPPHNSWLRRAL